MTAKVNDTLGDYDKAFFELEDFIESIYSIKLSLGSFLTMHNVKCLRTFVIPGRW